MPFDNQLRQALGMSSAPVGTPTAPLQQTPTTNSGQQNQPSTNTPNSTAYPVGTCAPQTYCSQSDGNIYYRATTCVDQRYQTCANGCSGLTCNATSTNSNAQLSNLLSPDQTTLSSNDNQNTSTNGSTSTFDLIDFFANPLSAVQIATATPIDITNAVQDTGNASVLQPSTALPTGAIQTQPQSPASHGPTSQQTFTSPDLANSPSTYVPPTQSTFTQNILAQMKTVLLAMQEYLRPFGNLTRPVISAPTSE